MIFINFGKWDMSCQSFFRYKRIYIDGYKWTPFVRVYKRYDYKKIYNEYRDRVLNLIDIHTIQGTNGNWNFDSYNIGFYNGLEMALAIMEGREPKYKRLKRKVR
jgi:hypothetical protein